MKRDLMDELAVSDSYTRNQLLKDYAHIIDEQREKLKAWEACADKLFSFAELFGELKGMM